MAEKQKPLPPAIFADKSLNHYAQFVKGGKLDEERLLNEERLNEKQLPQLQEALIAHGFMKEPKEEATEEKKAPARKK